MNMKWIQPRFAVASALLLVLTAAASATAGAAVGPVNVEIDVDDGCAAVEGDLFEVLGTSEWQVSEDPLTGVRKATKELQVAFQSTGEPVWVTAGDAGASGEPGVDISKSCSGGACAIVVHVYVDAVTSVRAHAGVLAFLPWAYARVVATTQVEVTVESEISCEGYVLIPLVFSGGVGPMTGAASFWKDDTTQEYKVCEYLNIPGVDESCTIIFSGPFEITAKTPGEYTRFDVLNGGRVTIGSSLDPRNTLDIVDMVESPETEVGGKEIHPLLRSSQGEWLYVFSGITLDVDTTEALELLKMARS